MINEETIIENYPVDNENDNGQKKEKRNNTWVSVTLGGVSGVLLGAGLMYAGQAYAKNPQEEIPKEKEPNPPLDEKPTEQETDKPQEEKPTEQATAQHSTEVHHHYHHDHYVDVLHVTSEHDDYSFGEAFADARAEVGPGGVFVWHGGVYSTYTAEEWGSMTLAERNEFAHRVNLTVYADEIEVPTDDNSYIDVIPVVDEQTAQNFEIDGDVHVVGYTDIDGHLTVTYDSDQDGSADVAIIDVDDNRQISNPDIIFDKEGNITTIGDLANSGNEVSTNQEDDTYLTSYEDNPDVADDTHDFVDDTMMDA